VGVQMKSGTFLLTLASTNFVQANREFR
jgi:hypothetical protein